MQTPGRGKGWTPGESLQDMPYYISATSGKWETANEAFYQTIFNFLRLSKQQKERAE